MNFEQRLDEAFGVKEMKLIKKTNLRRSDVGSPDAGAASERPAIPQPSHFADKMPQSGFVES